MTWHEPARLALEAAGVAHIETGDHYLVAQCDHATLATALRRAGAMVDALIVDAPYSERTHAGHDGFTEGERSALSYAWWTPSDVNAFVGDWHALVRGWFGTITDTDLMHPWARALEAAYRYTFSPLACVETGSRFRATGDGPPQWSTWLVMSRPRSREWMRWATIEAREARGAKPVPGAYVGPSERKEVTGGKPLWLMRAIVGDYSAPGDLVCDPCMGAGTTLVAAVELGRRAIGCEPDAGRFAMACRRLAKARPQLRMRLDVEATRGEQSALALGGDE
jgi:site-specific DNA-methyltransferase (adenine-specific)